MRTVATTATGGPRRRSPARRRKSREPLPSALARVHGGWRVFQRAASTPVRVTAIGAVLVALFFAVNWAYQVLRKPSELFFPVAGALYKAPSATWREYGELFTRYSTVTITPDFLAALAQVEAAGNPVARTYWRWSWTLHPLMMYRPASSAVGMYQLTDGTFAAAKHFCIRDHQVVEDGPWNAGHSCWFNDWYSRVIPSHAVEMTSAYLDRNVATVLQRHHIAHASLVQKQRLAALIHLCGAGAGDAYARRGLRSSADMRCGDHRADGYLAQVSTFQRVFRQLE